MQLMIKNRLLFLNILVLFNICISNVYANDYESPQRIRDVAKKFILETVQLEPGETIEVQANPGNIAFEVKACLADLAVSYPKDANREQATSVELTCNDSQPWQVIVPVNIQIFTKVLAAKRSIPPKQTLTEEDLDYTVYNKNHLYNGYFSKKEDVVGNQSTCLIPAGTILTKKNIELPVIIHRNQLVSISSQSNSVIVTMQGVAKTDGALNSVIKVFNPSSQRTIDAIVVGPNKAQVVT